MPPSRFSLASLRVARALLVTLLLAALAGSEAQGLFLPWGGAGEPPRVECPRWALHVLMAPDAGAARLPDAEDVSPGGDWDDDEQLPAEASSLPEPASPRALESFAEAAAEQPLSWRARVLGAQGPPGRCA